MKTNRIILSAILLLLVLTVNGFVAAAAEETTQSKLALDMVVVIDESGSMSARQDSMNDQYGYRHDAAASLVGLCDAEKSRVALLPFSSEVISSIDGVNELKEIDILRNARNRRDLLKLLKNESADINTLYGYSRKVGGETNLGEALERAVQILIENKSENRPVIVLLSDGDIEFKVNRNGKLINDTEKIAASEKRYRTAIETAKKNGITIFTVALKVKSKLLKEAADESNGLYYEISKAEDLPKIFNGIFAHLVGSDVVTLKSESVETGKNSYRTTFIVPNLSIAEANIFLPVGESGIITITKPNSTQPIEFNETNCLRYSTTYFTLIKILHPDQTGEWSIDYKQEAGMTSQQREALSKNSINVIFSYDVIPKVVLDSTTIHKTEQVDIDVFFYRKDGEKSNDNNLYNGGIKAWMEILDENGDRKLLNLPDGATIESIDLKADQNKFTVPIVFKELISNIKGGNYALRVYLKGDGMDSGVEQPIKIENLAPALTGRGDNPFADKEIHNPTRHDYEQEFEATIDLNQYIEEPDREPVYFTWMDPVGDDILVKGDLMGGVLSLKTKNTTGTETLKIRTYDDEGAETILEIPCKITVISEQIKKNYYLKITSDGENAEKGSECTYTAVLMNGDTQVKDKEYLDLVNLDNLRLKKEYAPSVGKEEELEKLNFQQTEDGFTATTTLSVNECTYEFVGDVFVRDIPISLDGTSFRKENVAPQLTADAENPFASVRIHDPITEDYENEAETTIDLYTFVSDADKEELTFSLLPAEGEEVVSKELDGSKLTLKTLDKSGKEEIKIAVKDPEGEEVTITIPVEITCVRDVIQKDYDFQFVFPEQIEKDTEIEIAAYIKNGDEIISDPEFLKSVDISGISLSYRTDTGETLPVDINLTLDGDKWTGKTRTSLKSGKYIVEGSVKMRGEEIQIASKESEGGTVGNKPPVLVEEYAETLQHRFEIEPFLWRKLAEDEIEIDLTQLFKDDPTDKQTYGVAYLPIVLQEGEENLTADDWFKRREELTDIVEVSGGKAVIENAKAGDYRLLVYTIDSDNQPCAYIYEQKIISQKHEVIILLLEILAGIVALALLITAWYWLIHRKAWTVKHGSVTLAVNSVPKPNKSSFPKRGKSDVMLSSLKIADVGTGELNTQLSAYTRMFKLRAGANGRVYVMRVKSKNTPFTMQIGTAPMNKGTKKLIWDPGQIMTIKTDNPASPFGKVTIDIKRETTMAQPGSAPASGSVTGRTPTPVNNPGTPAGGINRPRI